MPTVDERLHQVTSKLGRANEHIATLAREIKLFFDSKPIEVRTKRNPERRLVYYISRVSPMPESWPLIAGDAIQNLVTALDHLAYQLVDRDTNGKIPNEKGIYFPIAETQAKYEQQKVTKLQGASAGTLALVDSLRPYDGGNSNYWKLSRLNNIEKHRLLVTVGSSFRSVNVGPSMIKMLQQASKTDDPASPFHGVEFPKMDLHLNPADRLFPLEAGKELFVDLPDSEEDSMEFTFQIALHEPPLIEVGPLPDTLVEFATAVENALRVLKPQLA
jgi:hypothetical protein